MANGRPRRRSVFSGLLLILLGVLILFHNLRGGFSLWWLLGRWWPLLLIIWGLAKLYDHLAARRTGETPPRTITGADILLVVLMVGLVGSVGARDWVRYHPERVDIGHMPWEQRYEFMEEVPARPVPSDTHIAVRTEYGDIRVDPEETSEIRATAKKTLSTMSEEEAERHAKKISAIIHQSGDGYEVTTQNQSGRVQVDLEVHVPKQAAVAVVTPHGSVQVHGMAGSVNAQVQRGDIEIRDIGGDVTAKVERGDVHIVGAAGNVKLTGHGGEVEIADVKGEAVIQGEFYGPIRIEKAAGGARFISQRTDLTVSQLAGRVETGSGHLEITDAPGNVTLTTRKYDVSLENVAGRVHIENRDGNIALRLAQPPREPIEIQNESGNVDLYLPAKSGFEVHAESHSGEINCDFSEELAKQQVESNGNTTLNGKVGSKGPVLRLRTTYGTISLHKGQ